MIYLFVGFLSEAHNGVEALVRTAELGLDL